MSSHDNTYSGEAKPVHYNDEKILLNVHSGDPFGDYILVEELGQGGMGTVWKAKHFQLNNRYAAVKFITELSLKLLERFKKEIETINEIRHPNIINILTCNWDHLPPFYVMDYIAGSDGKPQDLSHLIAGAEIPLEDILKWTKQAASALEAAHQKNIIHRDIKPANLLLDADGNISVCDFGLVKVQNAEGRNLSLSRTGQFIGTPNYASPEQQRGDKDINHQTDIYSLGCVFYEMLTGERAGGAPPSAVRDGVSTAWDNIYWKMTFPKLERRFQSMTEVLEALNKLNDREPETVFPVSNHRWCPAGTFMMGSPGSEEGRYDREILHQVTLTQGFWMAETQVTQEQWQAVMGSNPSDFKGDNLPVEKVSWDDCQGFVKKLNESSVTSDYRFSLPTEAQWEYACRAGKR